MKSIRVLSYNIHKGFNLTGRQYVLDSVKTALHQMASQTDLVLLQEIGVGRDGSDRKHIPSSQFEYLADQTWHHYAYGKNALTSAGHHGNAILSRLPIEQYENIDVSAHALEKRGILWAKIKDPESGFSLLVVTIHFGLLAHWRAEQASALIKLVNAHPGACIVAGDTNDWDQRLSRRLLQEAGLSETFELQTGQPARTFPSIYPVFALDRIYCRGFEVSRTLVLNDKPWTGLSDHLPLWCELIPSVGQSGHSL